MKSILTIMVGLLAIYIFTEWKWFLWIPIIIGTGSLLFEKVAFYIEWGWMKLAWLLSFIVPNILLSLVFFTILTPIALAKRVLHRKNLLQRKDPGSSNWVNHCKKYESKHLEVPW